MLFVFKGAQNEAPEEVFTDEVEVGGSGCGVYSGVCFCLPDWNARSRIIGRRSSDAHKHFIHAGFSRIASRGVPWANLLER